MAFLNSEVFVDVLAVVVVSGICWNVVVSALEFAITGTMEKLVAPLSPASMLKLLLLLMTLGMVVDLASPRPGKYIGIGDSIQNIILVIFCEFLIFTAPHLISSVLLFCCLLIKLQVKNAI